MNDFYVKLQELLDQAVEQTTPSDWLKENNSITADIQKREGIFEVERIEYQGKEILVYARMGTDCANVYDIHRVVFQSLQQFVEHFLVFVPLHTLEQWQFWFITGGATHGHIVKIIVERATHPHIQG